MKSLVQKLWLVGLAVVIALPLAAAQKEAKDKEKKKGGGGPVAALKKQISDLDLTAEQKTKIDDIFAESTPKIEAAMKKAGDGPKKLADAREKAKGEGKKGKELAEAAKSAAKLTPDEQAGVDELEKATSGMRSAVAAVLTDEQKDKAGLTKKKKKKDK